MKQRSKALRPRTRSVVIVAALSVVVLALGTNTLSAQTRAAGLPKTQTSAAKLPSTGPDCTGMPSHAQLQTIVRNVVSSGGNGGLGFNMWATLVNRDGFVCAVAFSGNDRDAQWPGSRVISAQKAHTANAFSQPRDGIGGNPLGLFKGLSLSTANIYSAVQPGGSLYGLQHSNPVDAAAAYSGDATRAGSFNDPLVGKKIGGVNVFGGGLALYNRSDIIGGIGVSGDTSCTDHVVAWKMRDALKLDFIPSGVLPKLAGGDNIIHDIVADKSASGFGHPMCVPPATAEAALLPVTHPLS